jgi:UDP-N-acetylmuramoyl-L-alanyl-D-glutamate--2,6-diaminopimelate ligase
VEEAKRRGAAAILSAGDLHAEPGLPHVVSDDARGDFAEAASLFYPRRPSVLVGVTGTNGKSSTVDFLRQIWAHAGRRAASMGTLGAIWNGKARDLGHTTADPVQIHKTLQTLADEGVTHAAMEVSSHGLDQHRVDGVAFQAGAFTNLTQDHLDYHRTMEAYRAAKLKLWRRVTQFAVINADSPGADNFARAAEAPPNLPRVPGGLDPIAAPLRVVTAGWRAGPEGLKIAEIAPRPASQTLTLKWRGAEAGVELPLIGEFQALNAVMAATLALVLGEAPEAVWAAMETLKPVKGRMEHVGATDDGAHVFVDYAHTPDGLDALLRAVRPHAPGRIVLVFGCGGDRDRDKRAKMGAIAAKLADAIIVTDDNPRTEDPAAIRRAILAAAPGAREVGDRAAAIREGAATLKAGDALIIAGKGHETWQIIGEKPLPFSDQTAAREALASLKGRAHG